MRDVPVIETGFLVAHVAEEGPTPPRHGVPGSAVGFHRVSASALLWGLLLKTGDAFQTELVKT